MVDLIIKYLVVQAHFNSQMFPFCIPIVVLRAN